jgi:DNA-binding XRE family transcriptional regulator
MERSPRSPALRERRRQSGLTQGELAVRAGVSRQLVAAVESGQNVPSVEAALRLASVLATTVEALFPPTPRAVVPAVGKRLPEGRPLRVGRVGDQLVAAELSDPGATWARPDGRLEAGKLRLFEHGAPAGLVLAGCDPALGVAEAILAGLGERSLVALSAPTGAALKALELARVHAAVVHGPGELEPPPFSVLRLHLARWQVGLSHPPGVSFTDFEGILESGLPVVQREPAASSQQALERALHRSGHRRLPAGPLASGHIEAARTAAILGCAALTTESAARAFDQRFLALEEHTVEVWVGEQWSAHPAAEALGDLLGSSAFIEPVGQFGGYELAGCGSRL